MPITLVKYVFLYYNKLNNKNGTGNKTKELA